jgi:uncharacterized protein YoaH (UPF0181 family)
MTEQIRRYLIGLMALGLALGYSVAAAAQEIIEETYTVEEAYPPAAAFDDEDEDDEAEIVIADQDAVSQCAATFRSFDADSGTYVTYAGETLRCPYLD